MTIRHRSWVGAALGLALPLVTAASASAVDSIKLPSLDGTLLATDIYHKNDEPRPVVVVRTPYGKEGFAEWGATVEAGGNFVLVTQDWRGTGASEGAEHESWSHNADDGRALVDFIKTKPWSNGHVSMTGGSALGIAQYVTLPGADLSLGAFSPVFSTGDLLRYGWFQGGVVHMDPSSAFGPSGLRTVLEQPDTGTWPTWEEYIESPIWATQYLVNDAQAASVNAVGLHRGGFFDLFGQGMLDSFRRIQTSGGEGAKGRQKIVMGVWSHGGKDSTVGELTFPASATMDASPYNDLAAKWLTGASTGDWSAWDAAAPVHVYVMGPAGAATGPGNTWRSYAAWPPPSTAVPQYFSASGGLPAEVPDAGEASFVSDPSDPCPSIGGNNLIEAAGPYDQRTVVESRPDVVVFTSPPSPEAVEIVGRISADIWISTDVPDVDIVVRMTDVYPDNRSMLMAQGIQRARYRDGVCPAPLEPGVPTRIRVDMFSTALVLAQGHAMRVIVSASAAPLYAVNPQNGESFIDEKEPTQSATIKVLVGGATPSALVLPVVSRDGVPLPGNTSPEWAEQPVEPCGTGAGGSTSASAGAGGGDGNGDGGPGSGAGGLGAALGLGESDGDGDGGCGCRASAPNRMSPWAVACVILAVSRRRKLPKRAASLAAQASSRCGLTSARRLEWRAR